MNFEYLKYFKVIYIDNYNTFNECLNFLLSKIIISGSLEIKKLCYQKGIKFIFCGQIMSVIDKVNLIITSEDQLIEIEKLILNKKYRTSIIYTKQKNMFCGICGCKRSMTETSNNYCSSTCMKSDSKFGDLIDDQINGGSELILKFENNLKKQDIEKTKNSIEKNALRFQYACKRESYKKEMKIPSLKKTVLVPIKKQNEEVKCCKGMTKKGIKCTNKTLENSDYCGILSHNPIHE